MSKWKKYYEDEKRSEKWTKIDKIRRTKKTLKNSLRSQDLFEQAEDKWVIDRESGFFKARVVEVHKRYAFISPEQTLGQVSTKEVWLATVVKKYLTHGRNQRNFIAVGDRVLVRPATPKEDDSGSDIPRAIILNVAPRHSKLSRVDPVTKDREHILACNIDQLVMVASYLHPKIKWGLIDRYLVLATEQKLPAVLIFNKRDLLDAKASSEFRAECCRQQELYRSLGYQVLSISTLPEHRQDVEIKKLFDILRGKISIFSGHSGVGKSSIINLFKPEIVQEVEKDPNIFYKGRHTTTYASFIGLGIGGYVVDTPGIRSFVLQQQGAINLSHYFVEFRPIAARCKFRECRHVDEPGCAVLEAVESGAISKVRYRSYLSLLLNTSSREGRITKFED